MVYFSRFLHLPGTVVGARRWRAVVAASLCIAVAACGSSDEYASKSKVDPKYGVRASPRVVKNGQAVPKGGGRYMVGKPYKIAGKTYYPKEQPSYRAKGKASWYGAAFHGRKTANGEVFDKESLTAAHPTLPLPSYVRVTNRKNGRSMTVRVNDRGPFHGNRILDVSERVASLLGFKHDGIGEIEVRYLDKAPLHGQDAEYLVATLSGPGVDPSARRTMVASASPAVTREHSVRRSGRARTRTRTERRRSTPPRTPASPLPPTTVSTQIASVPAPIPSGRPFRLAQRVQVADAYDPADAYGSTPAPQPTFSQIADRERTPQAAPAQTLSLQDQPVATGQPFPLPINGQALDAAYYGTQDPAGTATETPAHQPFRLVPPAPLSYAAAGDRISAAFEVASAFRAFADSSVSLSELDSGDRLQQSSAIVVRVGIYRRRENAARMAAHLAGAGVAEIEPLRSGGETRYVVSLTPLGADADGEIALAAARSAGASDAFLDDN